MELQEILNLPRKDVSRAVKHEDRVRFHATTDIYGDNPYINVFLDWVKGMLPTDKYNRFCQMLTFPLPTVEIIDSAFKSLSDVSRANDRFINIEFSNENLSLDFAEYRKVIKDGDFWSSGVFELIRSYHNSLLVCDVKEGKPYYYPVPVNNVLSYEIKDKKFEYILFDLSGGRNLFIDTERFLIIEDNEIKSEQFHLQGDCPVFKMFGHLKEGLNSESPISSSLGRLDKLLLYSVSADYYRLYGSYPIMWMFRGECDYKDHEGNQCEGGFTYGVDEQTNGRIQRECPTCANKSLMGAGTIVEVEPFAKDVDLREPLGIIPPDVPSLQYGENYINKLGVDILSSIVGVTSEHDKAQKNELQVVAGFESREDVLLQLKGNLESNHLSVLESLAKYLYGNRFKRATVDWGSKYFMKSLGGLSAEYQELKTAGRPMFELAIKRKEINEQKNQNNVIERERYHLLEQLEPFTDSTLKELKDLGVTGDEFLLKLHFNSLISKFERENGNIIVFASEIDTNKKIDLITNILNNYVREFRPREETPATI
jgi:hypothetical protein